VVSAVTALVQEPKAVGEVFNIGNGAEVSIGDLALKVKAMTGSDSPIERVPYNQVFDDSFEDMPRRVPDIEKIARVVGYKPPSTSTKSSTRVIDYWTVDQNQQRACRKLRSRSIPSTRVCLSVSTDRDASSLRPSLPFSGRRPQPFDINESRSPCVKRPSRKCRTAFPEIPRARIESRPSPQGGLRPRRFFGSSRRKPLARRTNSARLARRCAERLDTAHLTTGVRLLRWSVMTPRRWWRANGGSRGSSRQQASAPLFDSSGVDHDESQRDGSGVVCVTDYRTQGHDAGLFRDRLWSVHRRDR
jgi:hypothetical protein